MVVNMRWPKLMGDARAKRIAKLVPEMMSQGGGPTPWLDRVPLTGRQVAQ
jgi:hypothetical protein